ncbi:MAG: prepilin-type N-terminal cleavage/methylation domain-containing protein [Fibrobacter sp.]|jgi:prepilin-type N-terminal cleavage/methylation domain-containing protein|nr:prepilin-type N-terminal cleavage/methylation domain-containing protein [Fibrobacter sp.]
MKRGFTLAECMAAVALIGIFSLFSMMILTNGFDLYQNYRKRSSNFFEQTAKAAKADRMVKENRGICSPEGDFTFAGEAADSLWNLFPYPSVQCIKKEHGYLFLYADEWSSLIKR